MRTGYPSECIGCRFLECGLGYVAPDTIGRNTRLVVYGETPGEDEVRLGQGFVGRAGTVARIAANLAGLNVPYAFIDKATKRRVVGNTLSEVAFANVMLCRPKGNKWPGNEIGQECFRRHFAKHSLFLNLPILSLGGAATQVLTGYSMKTTQEHGALLPWEFEGRSGWLTAGMHPSFIARQGGVEESGEGGKGGQSFMMPLMAASFLRALRQCSPNVPDVRMVAPEELESLLEVSAPSRVAVDIEGQGGSPVLVGVSWDPRQAYVCWWGPETREVISRLLTNERIMPVFHNAGFDIPELVGVGVKPPRLWIDTINTAAVIDPSVVGFFGLQQQVCLYVPGSVPWKGMVDHKRIQGVGAEQERVRGLWERVLKAVGKWAPAGWKEWYALYNGLDTAYTLQLSYEHERALGGRWFYYCQFLQPNQRGLMELGEQGLPVSRERLQFHRRACLRLERMAQAVVNRAAAKWLNSAKAEMRNQIESLITERAKERLERGAVFGLTGRIPPFSRAIELSRLRVKWRTLEQQTALNLKSPLQKADFLGNWLGLPLTSTKTKSGVSTNEEILERLLMKIETGRIKPKRAEVDARGVIRALIAGSVWGTWRRNFIENALRRIGGLGEVVEEEKNIDEGLDSEGAPG